MLVHGGARVWWLMLAGVFLVGCGQGAPKERSPTQERLYRIGKAYLQTCYILERAPTNFEEIKPSMEEDGIPDDLLISPRDGEPFVIFWGVDFTKLVPARDNPFSVAGYEKVGKDGTRFVLRFPIGIVPMTDEELQKAVFPPGHKAPD